MGFVEYLRDRPMDPDYAWAAHQHTEKDSPIRGQEIVGCDEHICLSSFVYEVPQLRAIFPNRYSRAVPVFASEEMLEK